VGEVREYGFAALAVAGATLLCFPLSHFWSPANLVMVYVLAVVGVARRGRRSSAAAAAALAVLAFDFCFVPPRYTFQVSDVQYLWTFVVMFSAAMLISHLTIRQHEEAQAARASERRNTWFMEKAKRAEVEAETERLRSSLLSSVSHDLRTPLSAILGSAGALLEKGKVAGDSESRQLLETIQEEGERLSRLVNNLLQVTRLEAGGLALQKEKTPLEEIVGSALERLDSLLKGRRIDVALPENLPLVPMDAMLVEQVFINLLENAARHTPEERPIDISARTEENRVVVSVSDRGPGLQTDETERIFDKFYHGASSPGAGLGLAICRAVVLAHGGRIWAENRPGGGARFQFTLPLL